MERKGGRGGEAYRHKRVENEVEEGLKPGRETEKEEEEEEEQVVEEEEEEESERDADPGAFGTIAYPAHLAGAGRGALSAISITNPGGCAFTSTRGRGPAARLNLCCPIF